jgi:hypothetical protein
MQHVYMSLVGFASNELTKLVHRSELSFSSFELPRGRPIIDYSKARNISDIGYIFGVYYTIKEIDRSVEIRLFESMFFVY